ncbi:MAG TPA: 3-oxoadipate enol-lactonase [Steroidobacteraceae bacterium]|jgi:3-oxoadipate enol-lactonase/4-carboxymuconolactone decarboxylase|nr:3-oxoadipate enol-lactonase [Steroidobacteraceae bacterium]
MAFASHEGARLYWRLDGAPDRPVLLLLNSIGADMSLWDRAAPHLLGQFRLLRMDTRGHGASDAPAGDYRLEQLARDALAVMDAAQVERAVVCGTSLGGMIALSLALQAPARVSALICACTSAQMNVQAWARRVEAVRAEGMAGVVDIVMQRFFADAFREAHPEVCASVRTGLMAMSADGYAGCAAAVRDMDLIGRIGAIKLPTLVISGQRDISTPFAGHGERILAAIADVRHVCLNAAHLACVEVPAAFAAALRGFVTEVSDGPALRAADEVLLQAGLKTRREVLGAEWVERALAARTPFNSDFQALITRYAWHEIWGRPGLDARTRRLLVLAMTVALGRWEEFRLHVRAGLQQGGFTEDELKEVLMQAAIYAGVPAANTAFSEAAAVINELQARGAG